MADMVFDSFKADAWKGNIDLDTDSFKGMLVTSSYTPTASHAKRSDITNEVAGTGYTAGGAALSGLSVTVDATNHRAIFTFTSPSWAASTITARGLVVYKSRGGLASADELVCYKDFGTNITSTAGTFLATVDGVNGVLTAI